MVESSTRENYKYYNKIEHMLLKKKTYRPPKTLNSNLKTSGFLQPYSSFMPDLYWSGNEEIMRR